MITMLTAITTTLTHPQTVDKHQRNEQNFSRNEKAARTCQILPDIDML